MYFFCFIQICRYREQLQLYRLGEGYIGWQRILDNKVQRSTRLFPSSSVLPVSVHARNLQQGDSLSAGGHTVCSHTHNTCMLDSWSSAVSLCNWKRAIQYFYYTVAAESGMRKLHRSPELTSLGSNLSLPFS